MRERRVERGCQSRHVGQRSIAFDDAVGYLVGDGHISRVKRNFGLTTGDEEQGDAFAALGRELFGIMPRKKLRS